MSPVLVLKAFPEFVDTECAQICDEENSELADAFVAQCASKVMPIYQIVPTVRSQNNWNAEFVEVVRCPIT